MKPALTNPSNRIRYYYENILRYDLLLKLNYKNIMQVPQICKIIILTYSVPYTHVKSVSLALEIICGQKVFCTILPDPSSQHFKGPHTASFGPSKKNWRRSSAGGHSGGGKGDSRRTERRFSVSQSNSALLYCSLRARTMYNFLEKLISLAALKELQSEGPNDSKIQILGQEVQVTLSNREVRLFPEIQNHFEFFECLQAVQIRVVTSASNEEETRLLWTGLQQKEI
jgi:ribosomal protein L5